MREIITIDESVQKLCESKRKEEEREMVSHGYG